MPLDDRCRLDQHHRVQTTRPQSVEPDPHQAVDREQPEPTRLLATEHVHLVTEGEVLQFQNSLTTEAAGSTRDDGTYQLQHAGDTTATLPKTLDFSPLSEFSVETSEASVAERTTACAHAAAIPWHVWCLAAAVASDALDGYWDISWHISIGRDTFWTPPHMMVYIAGHVLR